MNAKGLTLFAAAKDMTLLYAQMRALFEGKEDR